MKKIIVFASASMLLVTGFALGLNLYSNSHIDLAPDSASTNVVAIKPKLATISETSAITLKPRVEFEKDTKAPIVSANITVPIAPKILKSENVAIAKAQNEVAPPIAVQIEAPKLATIEAPKIEQSSQIQPKPKAEQNVVVYANKMRTYSSNIDTLVKGNSLTISLPRRHIAAR